MLDEKMTALADEVRRLSENNAAMCIDAMTAALKTVTKGSGGSEFCMATATFSEKAAEASFTSEFDFEDDDIVVVYVEEQTGYQVTYNPNSMYQTPRIILYATLMDGVVSVGINQCAVVPNSNMFGMFCMKLAGAVSTNGNVITLSQSSAVFLGTYRMLHIKQ